MKNRGGKDKRRLRNIENEGGGQERTEERRGLRKVEKRRGKREKERERERE